MNISEFARQVLLGGSLDDKTLSPDNITDWSIRWESLDVPTLPGRERNLQFSEQQIKFPKKSAFSSKEKRALAIHFFANHELLAIEMMAALILKFPHLVLEERSTIESLLETIKDEQKHFGLYQNRMGQLGVEFGDYPLNDYFWTQMLQVRTPEQFFALVSLTFETANLDFALYYKDIFSEVGDSQSADIMHTIYCDEIKHVSRGVEFLTPKKSGESLWNYYCSLLPDKMTPARAKGINFDSKGRKAAGLPKDFINQVESYQDNFRVTNRRQWKNETEPG